jgi:hypothetical protein
MRAICVAAGGHVPGSDGVAYGGRLPRYDTVIKAVNGQSAINQITP